MELVVKGRHLKLTDGLRRQVEGKLYEPLSRLVNDSAAQLEVELSDLGQHADQVDKRCRATVTLPGLEPLTVIEEDSDLYRAIDTVHDRLLTLVKRTLTKRRDRQSRPQARGVES